MQLQLDLDLKPQGYMVYINGRFVKEVETVDDVWNVIGTYPFGSLYEVKSANKDCDEFIPF